MKNKLLLIGGGGHCRSVLDCLLELNLYDEIGIIDRPGPAILGIPIIGEDADLPRLKKEGWSNAFVTVGSIGNTDLRQRLFHLIKDAGFMVPAVIDPTAVVGREVELEEGCFVGKRAILNAGSHIRTCAIVNSGAIVEHDCSIGEFAHISPGAVLCGNVSVGNGTHVGAGTIVKQGTSIGNEAMIGAGSIIISDVPDKVTVYGNPGREALK